MTSPVVSIVIPCYNGAQFVGDAIENALAQSQPEIEVVVIDDGSTDDSLRVIGSFGNRVRCESIPHGGACRARNRGAELARGEFVQFLDADDLLDPEKIERQVAVLRKENLDSVFCHVSVVPFDGRERGRAGARAGAPGKISRHCRHADPVIAALGPNAGTTAGLHRREAVLAIGGFRDDLAAAQERDLHLRLAASGRTAGCLDQVLATQRIRPGSISSSYLRVVEQYEKFARPIFDDLARAGRLTDERARAFAEFLARAARVALRYREHELADRYFSIARSMHASGGLEGAYGRVGRVLHRSVGPRYTALAGELLWRARKTLRRRSSSRS